MTVPKLFTPIQVGRASLQHRVVLAPLTRLRGSLEHVPSSLAIEYYSQRASVPGTLLITEATFIAPQAGGLDNVPGIWSEAQIEAWRLIVNAVHARGSYIFLQLWAQGRAANDIILQREGPYPYVAPSAIGLKGRNITPRPMTTAEIKEYVQLWANAAHNGVYRAGFDGVEVHSANGFLIDQFLQDVSNNRTDEYGGSIENRSRFALEVVDAVSEAIGEDRTGIRLSPWVQVQDMRMGDPIPQFSHVVSELARRHPSMAYVHLVEPRVAASRAVINDGATRGIQWELQEERAGESNDFIRDIWRPRPLISSGGYSRNIALDVAEKKGDLIAFGRMFISNPDLPLRLLKDIPLTKGDRRTYYSQGPVGYIDYPTAEEQGASQTPVTL